MHDNNEEATEEYQNFIDGQLPGIKTKRSSSYKVVDRLSVKRNKTVHHAERPETISQSPVKFDTENFLNNLREELNNPFRCGTGQEVSDKSLHDQFVDLLETQTAELHRESVKEMKSRTDKENTSTRNNVSVSTH